MDRGRKHRQFIIHGNDNRDDDVVGVVKLILINTITKSHTKMPPNDNRHSQLGTQTSKHD